MLIRLICCILLCIWSFIAVAADNPNPETLRLKALPGTVALTFDDGPSPIYTPQILAILKKYQIKATFFMMGIHAAAYPDMVRQVLADGHVIGNHTQTHPNLTKLNDKQLQAEITGPQKIIYNIIGKYPPCLRYPYGASNQHVRDAIRAQGMAPVSMGYNSFDYDRPGVQKIVDNVVNHAYSGEVILMHDGTNKREETVEALPLIIEGLKKKGLGFSQICV